MTDLLKTRPVQIWWLAVGMGITRPLCALLVLWLVMFPVPTVEAATRLTFDDGLTLVIQDSDFEADTLNGWFWMLPFIVMTDFCEYCPDRHYVTQECVRWAD